MTDTGNIETRPKSLVGAPSTDPAGDGRRARSWPPAPSAADGAARAAVSLRPCHHRTFIARVPRAALCEAWGAESTELLGGELRLEGSTGCARLPRGLRAECQTLSSVEIGPAVLCRAGFYWASLGPLCFF